MRVTHGFLEMGSVVMVFLALAMGGCGDGSGSNSGGGGAGGSSGGSTATGGGGASGCEAAAKAAGDKCAAEADRKCLFDAYVKMCATENAAAIQAEMECFTTDVCHTFSDPGETVVETCLASAYTAHQSDAAKAALAAYCGKCASNTNCPDSDAAPGIPFSSLSDKTLGDLKTCFDAGADCSAMDACLKTTLTDLAACF